MAMAIANFFPRGIIHEGGPAKNIFHIIVRKIHPPHLVWPMLGFFFIYCCLIRLFSLVFRHVWLSGVLSMR